MSLSDDLLIVLAVVTPDLLWTKTHFQSQYNLSAPMTLVISRCAVDYVNYLCR